MQQHEETLAILDHECAFVMAMFDAMSKGGRSTSDIVDVVEASLAKFLQSQGHEVEAVTVLMNGEIATDLLPHLEA